MLSSLMPFASLSILCRGSLAPGSQPSPSLGLAAPLSAARLGLEQLLRVRIECWD